MDRLAALNKDLMETGRKYRQTAKRNVERKIPLAGDSQNTPPEIAARQLTPGTQTAADEEAAALALAVAKLPEDSRAVLRMRNWERLSFEEIGKRMDRSAEAVRKVWSRAIVRLQQEMGS